MGKVMYMRKGDVHSAPVGGLLASSLAVGSTVKLMEDGAAAEYIVVNNGKPSGSSLYDDSCDGIWLLRKECYANRQFNSYTDTAYATSTIHSYLKNTFANVFDEAEQNAIKTVKIPYAEGGTSKTVYSGADGLETKAFLLAGYEVGFTDDDSSGFPNDGACLSYFNGASNADRIAYMGTTAYYWWLRSPYTSHASYAWSVDTSGACHNDDGPSTYSGIRPCVVIDSNAIFDSETLILKGVA